MKELMPEGQFYQRLVYDVKREMESGRQDIECFAARLWDQKDKQGLDIEDIAYGTSLFLPIHPPSFFSDDFVPVAGTAFEAGTDTTSGSILWFFMAMVLFPDAMLKAQAELDGVLGKDGEQMPRFSDYERLPYCVGLTKEVFRCELFFFVYFWGC